MFPSRYDVISLLTLTAVQVMTSQTQQETCDVTRAPGYDDMISSTWMFKEIQLTNSVSRLDCARHCLSHLACTAFMVDLATRRCRLHACHLGALSNTVASLGFRAYHTSCRLPGSIGSACVDDSDCEVIYGGCLTGSCHCRDTTSYDPNIRFCVEDCPKYGEEFTNFPNSNLPSANFVKKIDLTGNFNDDMSSCQAECVSYQACRFAELDLNVNHCRLYDSREDNSSLVSWPPGIYHLKRQCAYVES